MERDTPGRQGLSDAAGDSPSARNAFYKRRKREERHVSCDDPELEALAAVAVHASAGQGGYEDIFTRFDLSDAIDTAIAALPEAFRDVVFLIDVTDKSYESAAALLKVPERSGITWMPSSSHNAWMRSVCTSRCASGVTLSTNSSARSSTRLPRVAYAFGSRNAACRTARGPAGKRTQRSVRPGFPRNFRSRSRLASATKQRHDRSDP